MQPKAEIARAIGSPEIYPDLVTANASSERFIARSEHPCELSYSGLTGSYDSAKHASIIEELDKLFRDPNRTFDDFTTMQRPGRNGFIQANWWRYLAFGGGYDTSETDDFVRQQSFSYWRYVEGNNLYMIEDSGRQGRYYVGKINGSPGLAIIQDGNVTEKISRGQDLEYPNVDPDKLIEFYEATRSQNLFDHDNCPFVELVDPGGDNTPVFLQYHPTNQASPAEHFDIKNPTTTFFLRGATPPEGIEIKLYTREISDQRKPNGPFGTGPVHASDAAVEYYDPQSELNVICGPQRGDLNDYRRRFLKATVDHGTRTNAFKPRVTIGLPRQSVDALVGATNRIEGTVEAYIVSNGIAAQLQYYDRQSRAVVTL